MRSIEKNISPLIRDLFPDFYKEEGENFVKFVEAYYEWLDLTFPDNRNLLRNRDIDSTMDEFILRFKEKYLKNIQFDVASNKRLLVKNSLELFRSKGSENSIDLFFKLVYGTKAEVKNPGEYVFKLSDGIWERPIYLEVTDTNRNIDYVGSEITGTISGAKAFVEKYVRRKTKIGYVSILQISSKTGEFVNGEILSVSRNNTSVSFDNSPKVIGSLNEVEIIDSSGGFKVGEIVRLASIYSGLGALARVSEITNKTGAVDFEFIDGGWGYTVNSIPAISEKIAFLENVYTLNKDTLEEFDTVYQPLVNVKYTSTATLSQGDIIRGSGLLATVLRVNQNETVLLNISQGFIKLNGVYTLNSSTVTVTIEEVENNTTISRCLETPSTISLNLIDVGGQDSVQVGDFAFQRNLEGEYFRGRVTAVNSGVDTMNLSLDQIIGSPRRILDGFSTTSYTLEFGSRNDVDDTSNVWRIVKSHEFSNDDVVRYVGSTNSISGLVSGRRYFVVGANNTGFSLSQTRGGPSIPLIRTDTNQIHSFVNVNSNLRFDRFSGNTSSITVDNKINLNNTGPNRFRVNDRVRYSSNNVVQGLSNNSVYFVISETPTSVTISETMGGVPVNISSNGLDFPDNSITKINSIEFRSAGGINKRVSGSLDTMSLNVGLDLIRKRHHKLILSNISSHFTGETLSQFDDTGNETFRFRILTYLETSSTSAEITGVILFGGVAKLSSVVSGADSGIMVDAVEVLSGGDFVLREGLSTLYSSTGMSSNLIRLSEGSGASFGITGVENTQDVYVNTDSLSGNSVRRLDTKRSRLTLNNTTGLQPGNVLFQDTEYTFNSNTGISLDGGITLSSVVGLEVGDLLTYKRNGTAIRMMHGTVDYPVQDSEQFFIHSIQGNKIFLKSSFSVNTPEVFVAVSSSTQSFLKRTAIGTIDTINGSNTNVSSVFGTFVNTTPVVLFSNSAVAKTVNTVSSLPPVTVSENISSKTLIRESTYGFMKNPLSNIDTSIYNSLNFQKFELGTVSNLSNIDQGQDYNSSPVARVIEPFIASLGRRDFIFTVQNSSGNFAVGETVEQVTGDLTLYELQLQEGVAPETFFPSYFSIDSKFDIDETNDFIYSPSIVYELQPKTEAGKTSAAFNSIVDVNPLENAIRIVSNQFVVGDEVLYTKVDSPTIGLTNNSTYFVVSSNTDFVVLSETQGGEPVDLVANSSSIHKISKNATDVLSMRAKKLANNTLVKYIKNSTESIGLSNNTLYRVKTSNNYGITLKSTSSEDTITINPSSDSNSHFLRIYENSIQDGSRIRYETIGGSSIGVANSSSAFVISSNSSGFSLGTSRSPSSKINLNQTVASEDVHFFNTVQDFIPGEILKQDVVRQFNGSTDVSSNRISIPNHPFVNGDIVVYTQNTASIVPSGNTFRVGSANSSSIQLFSTTANTLVNLTPSSGTHSIRAEVTTEVDSITDTKLIVKNANRRVESGYLIYSVSNPNVSDLVVNSVISTRLFTTSGIVRSIDQDTLKIKRTTFENNFEPGRQIFGVFSGTTATLRDVVLDEQSDQIGYNAIIDTDVVSANGTIKTVQIIDSGLGYSNSEILQIQSDNKAGTAKAIVSGAGKSKGYYRSSKGFLSSDISLFDGDYYQEYSYEILSRVSFDKYKDMYKKVMHLAGTKVFGSILIEEENQLTINNADPTRHIFVSFNSTSDISLGRILVGDEKDEYLFDSMLINSNNDHIRIKSNLDIGDRVVYRRRPGVNNNIGLTVGSFYYVVSANSSGVVLSQSRSGVPVNITNSSNSINGHTLTKLESPFKVGDAVVYETESTSYTVDKKTDLSDGSQVVLNSVLKETDIGLENNRQYSILNGSLVNGDYGVDVLVDSSRGTDDLRVLIYYSDQRSQINFSNPSLTKYEVYMGEVSVEDISVTNERILRRIGLSTQVLNTLGSIKPFSKITLFTNISTSRVDNTLIVSADYDKTNVVLTSNPSYVIPQNSGTPVSVRNREIDFGKSNINSGLIFTNNSTGYVASSLIPVSFVSNNSLVVSSHGLSNNDVVAYYQSGENGITGLEDSRKYFVSVIDSNTIRLKDSYRGECVNVSSSNTASVRIRKENTYQSPLLFNVGDVVTYTLDRTNTSITNLEHQNQYTVILANSSAIGLGSLHKEAEITGYTGSIINIKSSRFGSGDRVKYVKRDTHSSIGLTHDSIYYVRSSFSNGSIELATSMEDSPTISLSGDVGINGHRLLSYNPELISPVLKSFNPYTQVNSDSNLIVISNNSMNVGDYVKYQSESNTRSVVGLHEKITINTSSIAGNEIVANNTFAENQMVMYETQSANNIGLENGVIYRIVSSNSSSFGLVNLETRERANLVSISPEPGHSLVPVYFVSSANGSSISLSYQQFAGRIDIQSPTAVSTTFDSFSNVSSNQIAANNSFIVNEKVTYTANSSLTALSGLIIGQNYFIKSCNSTHYSLSSTPGGATITLTPTRTEEFSVNNTSNVNATTDKIQINSHTFSSGDRVKYTSSTPIGGLTSGSVYFVRNAEVNFIQLSTTETGNIIQLTPASGTSIFELFQDNGHSITTYSAETSSLEKVLNSSGYKISYVGEKNKNYLLRSTSSVDGLEAGNTYYVVDEDGVSIALSDSPQGDPINIQSNLLNQIHRLRLDKLQ